ncbi:reticulon-like protein B17 isoform X2 [Ricinus communis]|uniref:reticulon-like protein B17 isoform X2 n=1 Tax=Ricinus communis TaxID=3988 RepID=UPI000772555F|nr:reticulon-like protein B17 isoform X2 [Ricinus communis]|eukprot:XP_015574015.1 reticulon-like protein B17 isoform X2 [Ricinus communis]
MDSTPPSHRSNPNSQTKSASRLARITSSIDNEESLRSSLDLILSPAPKRTPSTPSNLSLKSCTNSLPFHELLLLSPSPSRKSRTRLADRLDIAEEAAMEPTGSRRRCKSRTAQLGSPRISRRSRRRSEMEIREEKDLLGLVEEIGKARKRRHSGRSKKEKLSLVPSLPSSNPSPIGDCDGGNLNRIGRMIYDLIMWKDVAKSSLWFGFGCLCFLSSCFAKGISFSIFSAISQLGLLFLGASFISNSICQRNNVESRCNFKLKEEDILKLGRLILPPANLAISMARELFSGEPSMTLKVIPFLLVGAEYGHLITMWRLCAIGFFIGFTIPKLYSCYSSQINQKVDYARGRVLDAWEACSHKKIVAASAITAFWNMSSVKTRIFAAFIFLVILRCCRQHMIPNQEEGQAEEGEQGQQQQQQEAEEGEQEQQQALVVVAGVLTTKK